MTAETESVQVALTRRIDRAKAILTSSTSPAAAHMALKALDGSLPAELEADKTWHANGSGSQCCLAAWGDGWHTGYEEGLRRRQLTDGG